MKNGECQFRRMRKQLNMTQAELAKALRRGTRSITDYDEGKKNPPFVMKLAMTALVNGVVVEWQDN